MLYEIVYEDGDMEELWEEEVEEIVVNRKKKDKKRGDAKSKEDKAPVLTGTLSYFKKNGVRCHTINGKWAIGGDSPQSFELVRNLSPDEELSVLPKNGVFNGSFVFQLR